MLVTAESHNDILGKKRLGRGKKKYPRTNYKASTHHFRIGNWNKKKLGWGYVRLDTV